MLYSRPAFEVFPKPLVFLAKFASLCAFVILMYGSLMSGASMEALNSNDKILHIVAYAGFTGVLIPAFHRYSVGRIAWGVFFIGIAVEVAQMTVSSNRTGSVFDIMANTTGILCAVSLWYGFAFISRSRKHG